jgi:hypothetical protein
MTILAPAVGGKQAGWTLSNALGRTLTKDFAHVILAPVKLKKLFECPDALKICPLGLILRAFSINGDKKKGNLKILCRERVK